MSRILSRVSGRRRRLDRPQRFRQGPINGTPKGTGEIASLARVFVGWLRLRRTKRERRELLKNEKLDRGSPT